MNVISKVESTIQVKVQMNYEQQKEDNRKARVFVELSLSNRTCEQRSSTIRVQLMLLYYSFDTIIIDNYQDSFITLSSGDYVVSYMNGNRKLQFYDFTYRPIVEQCVVLSRKKQTKF